VKSGSLWRISLETTAEAEEAVAALFESLFGQTASIYTNAETNRTTCSVFLNKKPAPGAFRELLAAGLDRIREGGLNPAVGHPAIRRVRREDWATSWKRHFKPFTIGSQLLVKPSWSRSRARGRQKLLIIDPGLSFGTGQHPTTRFCLEQLVQVRNRNVKQSFLDAGTGSGILAIAATMTGYSPVVGFDLDPVAVSVAKKNARKNRARLKILRADIGRMVPREKYHVVCANLTADLLQNCARKLKAFLRPAGVLILAGILRTEFDSVRGHFEKLGFSALARRREGEWKSLALRGP
jgi:ribosomal protein L11 methyltransferase